MKTIRVHDQTYELIVDLKRGHDVTADVVDRLLCLAVQSPRSARIAAFPHNPDLNLDDGKGE